MSNASFSLAAEMTLFVTRTGCNYCHSDLTQRITFARHNVFLSTEVEQLRNNPKHYINHLKLMKNF